MVRKFVLVVLAVCFLAAASSLAMAQVVPFGTVPIASGGFAHSFQKTVAFGPFTPPVGDVSEQFYQYPGFSPFGAYPGGGYAYNLGVGPTPAGYAPYGGFTYL